MASFTTRLIEVTNRGDEMLIGTASTRPPFSVIHGGDYSISGGASALVYVRFTPLSLGDYSGTVTFRGGGGITVELVAMSMASEEEGNEGEEEGEQEGSRPDLCSMRGPIQSGYAALAAAFELPDADHDFDGLPDEFALALVCAACDREAGDGLRGATLNAFDINREALANEEFYESIEPHGPVLAALMLISRDMRDALRGRLALSDVQLSGIYESVASLDGEYMPSSIADKPLSEAYLVFEVEPKANDEPYSASGDFDLDGASNLSEFTQASIGGDATISNFIDAATDPLSAGSQEGGEESGPGCAAATGGSGLGPWGDAAMLVATIGLLLFRRITRDREEVPARF